MGKIVVSQFVTVDNVIEGPGDEPGFDRAGWAFRYNRGPEGDRYKFEEVMSAGGLLLGRKTYEGFASVWPTMTDPAGFADKMNTMPKFVVSRTLTAEAWQNTRFIGRGEVTGGVAGGATGNVAGAVAALREHPGGDILVNGSITLIETLVAHDLVDEYRLMVFPVVLGVGRKLFGEAGAAPADLRLVETRPVGEEGVLVQTYQRRG